MALRLIRNGNVKADDHSLLINRDKPNQHPITAIEGLEESLDEKYVKPISGIPAEDLSFAIVTKENLQDAINEINGKILANSNEIISNKNDSDTIKEMIEQLKGNNGKLDDTTINFLFKDGFREDYIVEGNDVIFNLHNRYIADNQHLRVYRNGELLIPNDDYVENSDTSIKMNYELQPGVILTFMCNSMSNVLSPIHEEIISTDNQLEFKLKNTYIVGNNSLSIYVNGLRLECGKDYAETDKETITLNTAFPTGTKLIFRQIANSSMKVEYNNNDYIQKTWKENINAVAGQTVIELNNTFIPGTGMIMVTLNGLLLWDGIEEDYIETNEKTLTFNYPLEEGDNICVICNTATNDWKEKFICNTNQKAFNLTKIYTPGKNELQVYIDGLLLESGEDYEETNYRTITLLADSDYGSKITVIKRR